MKNSKSNPLPLWTISGGSGAPIKLHPESGFSLDLLGIEESQLQNTQIPELTRLADKDLHVTMIHQFLVKHVTPEDIEALNHKFSEIQFNLDVEDIAWAVDRDYFFTDSFKLKYAAFVNFRAMTQSILKEYQLGFAAELGLDLNSWYQIQEAYWATNPAGGVTSEILRSHPFEENRVFHLSLANLTGNPRASIAFPWDARYVLDASNASPLGGFEVSGSNVAAPTIQQLNPYKVPTKLEVLNKELAQ